ncbi:PadR family transcriptional regulator, partial [Liberiplasma polymorphum]|uniref:PadR family transcriptional regulator n=1 Tax=Liberiplasma polymorphum TaxID=3374570 RepID=UPI0037764B5C
MSVQLKKGVLDLCVLSRLKHNDTYGYDIYQFIDKVLGISESTIYPILRKMVHEGYLDTYLKESPDGPARKYFSITRKGRKRLDDLTDEWDGFVRRVEQLVV